MASVHTRLRKDGSVAFRVSYRINGRQAQDSFDDPAAAERFRLLVERVGGSAAREILLEEDARDEDARPVPSLGEWMERYLDADAGHLVGIQRTTRNEYRRVADRTFLQRLADVPITGITTQAVKAWVNWQVEQPSRRNLGGSISAQTVSAASSTASISAP